VCRAGRQVLFEALHSDSPDSAQFLQSMHVKNTFIDIGIPVSPSDGADSRVTKSCTARLTDPSPHYLLSPTRGGGSPAGSPESAPPTLGGASAGAAASVALASLPETAEPMRNFTVKNTFINFSEEGSYVDINQGDGAKSCTARFSHGSPELFPAGFEEEASLDPSLARRRFNTVAGPFLPDSKETEVERPAAYERADPFCATWSLESAAQETASVPLMRFEDTREIRCSVKNTFLDFQDEEAEPEGWDVAGKPRERRKTAPVTGRCPQPGGDGAAPYVQPAPVVPPPAYAAPVSLEVRTTPPPPTSPPSGDAAADTSVVHTAGRQVLYEALQGGDSPETAMSENTGLPYNVKNTFIDVGQERVADDRGVQTCTARFSGTGASSASLFPPSPVKAAPALAPPSVGSRLHGTVGPDGQPACKPCAWFYKDGSCHNGADCGYCHLCPQGELKNRKKQKIASLRRVEAAQAAGGGSGGSPAGGSPLGAGAAAAPGAPSAPATMGAASSASKQVFLLSSHLPA